MGEDPAAELRLIRSRLDAIEHTQEVLVRADGTAIWNEIKSAFVADPLLPRVFLLVDGQRTQRDMVTELANQGLKGATEATVSRKLAILRNDLHLVKIVDTNKGNVHARTGVDRILNLQKKVDRLVQDLARNEKGKSNNAS